MGPGQPTTTPYRDEKSTLAWRLEKLHDELETVRQARSEIETLASRETELLAEITQLKAEMKKVWGQRSLPLLDLAYVASPCSADWNQMRGNERTRFCEDCGKNVYNLSAMSFDDAETFLRSLTGETCVRIHRRNDGTVLTQDCPVGVRRKRRKRAMAALVGSGMAVAGLATARDDFKDGMNLSERGGSVPEASIKMNAPIPRRSMEGMGSWSGPELPLEEHKDDAAATAEEPLPVIPWRPEMGRPTLVAGPSAPANPKGVEGMLIARCTITKNGTLRDCDIIAGPPSMKQAMLDMLSRQRYTPVFHQGKPVDVRYVVKFKLERPNRPGTAKASPKPTGVKF
jgi:hypothetical protein